MRRLVAPLGNLRRALAVVMLFGLGLSSVEVLWAEDDELMPSLSSAVATVPQDGSEVPIPAPPDEEGDDCPCLCACACANAQVVVLPDPATATAAMPIPLPVRVWSAGAPSHLLAEPLLPPPRS